MTIEKMLMRVIRVIVSEAKSNPDFRWALLAAVETEDAAPAGPLRKSRADRVPVAFDPVQVARDGGAEGLKAALSELTLEQLKSMMVDMGTAMARYIVSGNSKEKITDKIIEIALARSRKGDAFRRPESKT